MTGSPDLLRAALDYVERGWFVVPLHSPAKGGCSCGRSDCASPGKHPRTAHGLKDASREPAKVREWWQRWPDANIGVLTGPESGIIVLDVDGEPGLQTLIEFEGKGLRLPDTYSVTTGRGAHVYFQHPAGLDVRNSAGKIGAGLDIRGAGGYVVAAPSIHSSGARYQSDQPAEGLAPVPQWLLTLIQEANGAESRQSVAVADTVAGEPIGKGKRTNRLVSLAGSMHKRGMTPAAIEAALLAENAAKCFPPLPDAKVRAIAYDIPTRYPNTENGRKESPILKPDLIRLADVAARRVDWLWGPFIPARMLSMISGDPGAGKSFIALAVCADLSRGKLRDGRIVEPGNSLYLSIENPIAETIRPRFDLLGGDASRFFVLKGTLFAEDGEEQRGAVTLADIPILEAAIAETGARLIVIDPIQSYLGSTVDLHRSNETRPVLDGLSKLAESHGCAVLLLRHLSKQSGGKAIHRGLGSIDLSGAVRSELLAGSLPDNPEARALVHIKSNVGRIGGALGYSIDGEGRFTWTGESQITASDLLAAPDAPEDRSARDDAIQWLSDLLKDGGREQKEVRKLADGAGITYGTLRRAKDALRVRSYKATMSGPWLWALPEGAHGSPEDAHTNNVSTFAELRTFEDAQPAPKVLNKNTVSLLDYEGAQTAVCEHLVSTFEASGAKESSQQILATIPIDDIFCSRRRVQ